MPKGVYSRNTKQQRKARNQAGLDRRRGNSESGQLGTPVRKSPTAASANIKGRDQLIERLEKQRDRIDATIEHLREL